MVEKRVSNLAMEVSSHSIVQHRIKGSKFRVVAFSNLTQDHLDYHKSMENYFKAKADLFNSEFAESAVINIDDSYGLILSNQIELPHQSVSRTNKSADWFYKKIDFQKSEYNIEINSKNGNKINGNFKLLGEYNLDNLLLAVALASATGLDDSKISLAIPKIKSIPGRLEQISAGQEFTAIVDYAHTPDAVSRVLETARSFTSGKVIALLGCGGDRDKSKRPLMGKALFAGSDVAVFTSDNPRSESPDEIISAMINGIDLTGRGFIVNDRKTAIDFVVSQAVAGDCVLVLGKGHESGQEIMGVTTTFDDRIELANSITKAAAR
jgi:UDP-N-acetylmuramoyl-L-alanyl-D-glutamate--2,6-diaminopimelate ligase